MEFRPWTSLFFCLLCFCFLRTIIADDKDVMNFPPPYAVNGGGGAGAGAGGIDNIGYVAINPSPPPPDSDSTDGRSRDIAPFRPSIAVIVGVLTTMFSITFLLLLYAKHCKRGNGVLYGGNGNSFRDAPPSSAAVRKNSGIDRTVIESLPIFRFGSLRGQKDGLECAVCLTRFETTEVLRLLPKCKHAFHVECVDTWLDAHSTCPLCRYRVDPEDILLVEDAMILRENEGIPPPPPQSLSPPPQQDREAVSVSISEIESRRGSRTDSELKPDYRRVSGRHSSAGERGRHTGGFLQIVLQKPGEPTPENSHEPTRRSLDSSSGLKRKSESVSVGCFEQHRPHRKDGLLLSPSLDQERTSFDQRRFEHRIIVSAVGSALNQRWSDVNPSDLLYLRSEMLISDNNSRRYSSASGSRLSSSRNHHQQQRYQNQNQKVQERETGRGRESSSSSAAEGIDGYRWSGRNVINSRSVSEITGLNRFASSSSNYKYNNRHQQQQLHLQQQQKQQRQAGLVSRWLAWISQSQPAVRSEQTANSNL